MIINHRATPISVYDILLLLLLLHCCSKAHFLQMAGYPTTAQNFTRYTEATAEVARETTVKGPEVKIKQRATHTGTLLNER